MDMENATLQMMDRASNQTGETDKEAYFWTIPGF